MKLTHADAERRYTEIRKITLEIAASRIPNNPGVELRCITDEALIAAKAWANIPGRLVDWDWRSGYRDFSFRHPKRFELAIWHQGRLLSMTLGRPTYHGSGLRLDFIEANPTPDRIVVLPVVLLAMTVYAQAIGACEIRITSPINKEVQQYYEGYGLTYVAKGNFLYRKIQD